MRQGRLILDTGPLVAYLDRREDSHPCVRETFKKLHPPLLTCEAVITESCFLLQHLPDAIDQIGMWMNDGHIQVVFSLGDAHTRVFELMQKYRDLPMALADACLVVMIEKGIGSRVFTLDGHFNTYRHSGRRVLPVLMPEE